MEEITPEGSAAPVYLDPTPVPPSDLPDLVQLIETREALRQSAIASLVAGVPLTPDQAATIVGL